jgi:predicted RNA-binding Zn ribbon-like protein
VEDRELTLEVLNSAPAGSDAWSDDASLRAWLRDRGFGEAAGARDVRADLQAVARGAAPAAGLRKWLNRAVRVPAISATGELTWATECPESDRLAVHAILGYFEITATMPGRLRPCANPECRLFLLDESRSGTARWCSMATCGNRLKARRHHARGKGSQA